MTRELLDKVKALVEKRQKELKASENPKDFAGQRLVEGGLFLKSGAPNPIFDSQKHEVVSFGFVDLKLPSEPAVPVSPQSGGGYIFASIGEKLEKVEIVRGFEHPFPSKKTAKKLAAIERPKITHKNK